jgi:hypothetical protein
MGEGIGFLISHPRPLCGRGKGEGSAPARHRISKEHTKGTKLGKNLSILFSFVIFMPFMVKFPLVSGAALR